MYHIWNIYAIIIAFGIYLYTPSAFQFFQSICNTPNFKSWIHPAAPDLFRTFFYFNDCMSAACYHIFSYCHSQVSMEVADVLVPIGRQEYTWYAIATMT